MRCFPMLDGYRGSPRCDIATLAELVARVSGLLHAAADRIREIEFNPVRAYADGVAVLDALVALA